MDPIDHLFRRESGRMIATVARIFGLQNFALAEDVVQDAFCRAVEVWKVTGSPGNPAAWLMATAKHRALDALRRERTARKFAPELMSEWSAAAAVSAEFAPHAIRDDQLRLMFSCCAPRLGEEAQIALILHLLCGFGVHEIGSAFLTGRPAIEKRITRAKHALAESGDLFDLTDADFANRLAAVRRSLYLLFNEGYHGASTREVVRAELCLEAIRLGELLLANPFVEDPATLALVALMCLHAARLPARLDSDGNLVSLADQDRSLWDLALIEKGSALLERAATGEELTDYHLEAMIASVHTRAASFEETNWRMIVDLYDALSSLRPNPIVRLNRAIAIAQADGPETGLTALEEVGNESRLEDYPFYWAARADLEMKLNQTERAEEHFRRAESLARNAVERGYFAKRGGISVARG